MLLSIKAISKAVLSLLGKDVGKADGHGEGANLPVGSKMPPGWTATAPGGECDRRRSAGISTSTCSGAGGPSARTWTTPRSIRRFARQIETHEIAMLLTLLTVAFAGQPSDKLGPA